uniref:Protein Vpu n=1 Tax=Human immunodeficiency virus type 1 TaxID=11676 RepID=I6R0A5_HV1|nr:vpu protein [Human immunodeficiency virus 1]
MSPLEIIALGGLIESLIAPILVWTILAIEIKKILWQKKIYRLFKRIKEKEKNSGNESEGDTHELGKLVEMGDFDPWVGDNL